MARDEPLRHHQPPQALATPSVSLIGQVNQQMVEKLRDALAGADNDGDFVVEMTTPGGDADLGRRLAHDIRRARSRRRGRTLFVGRTQVYSAGVTAMAAFKREDRFLSDDAVLLIHCRQLRQTIELNGPLRSNLPLLDSLRTEIEMGIELEAEGFRLLVEGSDVTLEEVYERAAAGWYLKADEALQRGLVANIV
jgi:ATP-dependent protease ClpP protease subunit